MEIEDTLGIKCGGREGKLPKSIRNGIPPLCVFLPSNSRVSLLANLLPSLDVGVQLRQRRPGYLLHPRG